MAGISIPAPSLLRLSARASPWPAAHPAHTLPAPVQVQSLRFAGPGFVAGTVKVLTLPAARTVRLYDRSTGLLARQTTSDPSTGAYRFERLALGRQYLAVALDDASAPTVYNAAVADLVTAGSA